MPNLNQGQRKILVLASVAGLLYYFVLLFHSFWFQPLFERFDGSIPDSFLSFSTQPKSLKYIFLFRLFSGILSIPVCLVCLLLAYQGGFFERSKIQGSKWTIPVLFFVNLVFSIFYNIMIPKDFSLNSYISHINFVVTYVVFFSITGPIIEEIVFRVSIFSLLRDRGSFFFASSISSIGFGFLHFRSGFIWCAISSLLGFLWSYSYEKSLNPYVPIAFHIVSNTITTIFFLKSFA